MYEMGWLQGGQRLTSTKGIVIDWARWIAKRGKKTNTGRKWKFCVNNYESIASANHSDFRNIRAFASGTCTRRRLPLLTSSRFGKGGSNNLFRCSAFHSPKTSARAFWLGLIKTRKTNPQPKPFRKAKTNWNNIVHEIMIARSFSGRRRRNCRISVVHCCPILQYFVRDQSFCIFKSTASFATHVNDIIS